MSELSFKTKALRKLVENVLSVKVWFVMSVLGVSTGLILIGKMSGNEWSMVNGGVISTICAIREAFKIEKIASDSENNSDVMP